MPTGDSLSAFYGGGGQLIRVTVPDTLGVSFSQAVPAGVEWRWKAGSWLVATDVTVITRFPVLNFTSGGLVVYHAPGGVMGAGVLLRQSAGRAERVQAGFGLLSTYDIPDMRLLSGDTISLAVGNVQAGDAILDIQLLIEQYVPDQP